MKDRAAARMILDGEASGALTPGRTILDATSGNTGIAYAMVGAARGYKVKLCLPENASPERKLILRAFGAELVLTESARRHRRRDPRSAPADRRRARIDISTRTSTATTANWRAHYDTTGPEIIEQTSGRLTHFVAGPRHERHVHRHRRGACGEFNPAIKLISFQPDSPFHGLEGLKHMESAIVPGIYDPTLADEDLARRHRGRASRWCAGSRAKKGLLVGHLVRRARWRRCFEVARRLDTRRHRHGVSRRRREISDRKVLDRPMRERRRACLREPRVDDGDPPPRRGDVSARVLRRARRHRRHVTTATVALPNTTEEGPRRRFLVRPSDYRLAEQRAAELGGELLGFYHSHPDHPARPSQFDLDHAWPTFAYVIVGQVAPPRPSRAAT